MDPKPLSPTVTRAEREVKEWLRTCNFDAKVSTPLTLLWKAYSLQDGRHDRVLFRHTVVHRCAGLRKTVHCDRTVVHGIAPRWSATK